MVRTARDDRRRAGEPRREILGEDARQPAEFGRAEPTGTNPSIDASATPRAALAHLACTIRNGKLDTRSARARLPINKGGYWVSITRGFAIGYRKGPKGGVWLARLIDAKGRREATLGPADDAIDADGERILDYGQAQAKARAWLAALDAGGKAGPYIINRCLDDYIADYKRRGGKALDRLEISANAFIRPQLGHYEVAELTAKVLRDWHAGLAAAPPPTASCRS